MRKKYIDIERIKTKDTDYIKCNTDGFNKGDIVSIQEKIDGSSAGVEYIDGELVAYSRRQTLNFSNTLVGFWNYVQNFNAADWEPYKDYVIFGEWCRQNKIHYNPDWYGKWIIYDIWDKVNEQWMLQEFVKKAATDLNLEYIHVLYEGPFISWEHCRSFMHSPHYGDTQEGIVIKNQTRLHEETRVPKVLKIVNEEFSEVMNQKTRVEDPEKVAARVKAEELASTIVTVRRVEKGIEKLRDEGVIPLEIQPKDMKLIAKSLPRYIYNDCKKEEPETVITMGELGGKIISSLTMRIARSIVLGD